jgi:iron complex outermembrane receptor protein
MRNMHKVAVSLIALVASSVAAQASARSAAPSATTDASLTTPRIDATAADEIVVTATKREQTLQDVPISVSVTSEKAIEREHIEDLIDLQRIVPSLQVAQFNAVGQTNFVIRGFGNGAGNDGIESSVGVFVDGVYRSRTSSALDDLPEVERIEVLRGPQSTLFGKNVSAGAISIITRKPQFTFGGKAEVSAGNYGSLQTRATFTGPLSDTLAFRISGSVNQRDGFERNIVDNAKINDRHRWAVRGDLLWQPTADISVRVIADYNRIREKCCGVVQLQNGPASQFIGAPAPFGLGAQVSDPTKPNNRDIAFNTDPTNRLSGKGISGQIDWNLGFARATSITAYRQQGNQSTQDVDFTGADIVNKNQVSDIKTFTQEFRLASTGKGPFTWLIGGFYDHETLLSGVDTTFGSQSRSYVDGLTGGNITLLEKLQGFVTPAIRPGLTYFQPGQGIHDFYHLTQDSYSLFGQADYKVTPRLTVTGGVAYLSDRKKASSDVSLTDSFSLLNLQNVPQLPFIGVPANAFGGLGVVQFFYGNTANHAPVNFPNAQESGVLKGHKVTYTGRAAYDLDIVNLYASYTTGWKGGAYNLSSDGRPPDANGIGRTANPENVTLYEVGAKAKFHGGFLNIAVFKQSIKDFQLNLYTGTGYALVNAGKESAKGFEVDTAYQPAKWLGLTGAVTYLDAKYDSFTRAPCFSYDTVRCPVNPLTGQSPIFRDLSGTRPSGIARWTYSTSATLSQDLGGGLSGYIHGEYNFTSKTPLTDTTPPNISTYGQSNIDASVGITSAPLKLELMLWARNLTNHYTIIYTFPTVAQTGSYSGFPNDPRTYGVTIRKTF